MPAPVLGFYQYGVTVTQPTAAVPTATITAVPDGLNADSAAPITSVSQLASNTAFGGDMVTIQAGPGGVFGNAIYAISRGAGSNSSAINRPGVIYRVDPATGQSSVFFDLNNVINQFEPGATAGNNVGAQTGLVNWYSIAFDPEGTFNGKPAMFVASVDRADPNKNVIFEIAPDGSLIGAFVQFTNGQSANNFKVNPTSIVVPPPEQSSFLRGLIVGSGVSSTNGEFSALYFNANQYTPGQVISNATLPTGVETTAMTAGPQVGLTAANPNYVSPIYSTFTDFGTPAAGGIPAAPGVSGIQGLNGDLPLSTLNAAGDIGAVIVPGATAPATQIPGDAWTAGPTASTTFRQLQSIAFDQYGYFSFGVPGAVAAATGGAVPTSSGPIPTPGGSVALNTSNTLFTATGLAYEGNLFFSDLATGLTTTVTPVAPLPTTPVTVPIISTAETVTLTLVNGVVQATVTPTGDPINNGRIFRMSPSGVVTPFATNFDTTPSVGSGSFVNSNLSISFSADGTALYAADANGIWLFKTTSSLATSTSGSQIGLNDLRTLGVPYDGLGTAVAVLDTGVDATNPGFRGRVAAGTNVFTNGFGNIDTAPGGANTVTTTGGAGGAGGTAGGGTGGTGTAATAGFVNGHGTDVAGVVAQLVPQATIVPVNVFAPFIVTSSTNTGTGTGTAGGTGNTGTLVGGANATTNSQFVWKGLGYIAAHPFVNDPVRAGRVDRVTTSVMGFGTPQTYANEVQAFHQYPQVVIALKNQLHRFRKLGITPVAASGQFGAPFGSSASTTGTGGTAGGTGTTVASGQGAQNASQNPNAGDVNGMSLPAVLNEVVSVTGTFPFPFDTGANVPPTNPFLGGLTPFLVYGNSTNNPTGVTATAGTGTGTTTTTTTGTSLTSGNNSLTTLTAGNLAIYPNTLLASANRGTTTDYAAPAIDVPTFNRANTTSGLLNLTFLQGGTSMSAGIVGGAFDLVSSALDWWTKLNQAGSTSDAYLNTPVGTHTLNFGVGALKDLSPWNTPDGINAILAWTANPITDANNGLSINGPNSLIGSAGTPLQYAGLSIGNAIAAVEGYVAINYLLAHNDFQYITTNGIVTAQDLQNFTDNAAAMGMPEAGAMARLLGGTARTPGSNGFTGVGESPNQPDVLQRRFNFFDYAANGQLQGGITLANLKVLAHTLLPTPDSFTIIDRQRASANGFLLEPNSTRNFVNLQHLLPQATFVPPGAIAKYRGISPRQFGVNAKLTPGGPLSLPNYTLFAGGAPKSSAGNVVQNGLSQTPKPTTPTPTPTTPTSTTPTSTASTTPTTPTSTTPTSTASSTPTTSTSTSTSYQQSILQALQALAAQKSATTSTGTTSPQPAGTLLAQSPTTTTTPTATTTPTTSSTSTSSSTAANYNPMHLSKKALIAYDIRQAEIAAWQLKHPGQALPSSTKKG